ncbi:hypothetical protein D3C77_392600 [compost metagenome]
MFRQLGINERADFLHVSNAAHLANQSSRGLFLLLAVLVDPATSFGLDDKIALLVHTNDDDHYATTTVAMQIEPLFKLALGVILFRVFAIRQLKKFGWPLFIKVVRDVPAKLLDLAGRMQPSEGLPHFGQRTVELGLNRVGSYRELSGVVILLTQ